MKTNFGFRRLLIGSAGLVVLLTACGSPPSAAANDPAEDELLARARSYWDAMKKNDPFSAWKFEAASKDQSLTMEAYFKRGGIVYDAVEVRGVQKVSGDVAVVDVLVRYTLPLVRIKNQEAALQDYWRRIDGVWYHELRRGALLGEVK